MRKISKPATKKIARAKPVREVAYALSGLGATMYLIYSEVDFQKLKAKHGGLDGVQFNSLSRAMACTHLFDDANGERVAIIVLKKQQLMSFVDVFALLAHEAVHVWQDWCECVGEDSPAIEQEAYAIQGIAHALFTRYALDHPKNNLLI
jgi:hypothetical protein